MWKAGKHLVRLPIGHRHVRAQGRHDVGQPVAEMLVGQASQRPGQAVDAREIGRQGQYSPGGRPAVQHAVKQSAQLLIGDFSARAARGYIDGHLSWRLSDWSHSARSSISAWSSEASGCRLPAFAAAFDVPLRLFA